MQRRFAPLWSTLIVGVVAAVWHTPAFFLSGTNQAAWSFWPFFFGVVAISVILTPMFNGARGSLLVAALFHAQMNGPAWPDAQPWDMVGFCVVALVVAVLNRRAMPSKGAAATEVLLTPSSRSATPAGRSGTPGYHARWVRVEAALGGLRPKASQSRGDAADSHPSDCESRRGMPAIAKRLLRL